MDHAELLQRKADLMGSFQTLIGHLQEIDYWIEQLDKAASIAEAAIPEEALPDEPQALLG